MDAADRAQDDQDAELANQLDAALSQVHAALGAAGAERCVDCAEPIPPERRRAVPSAARCVHCQEWAELHGKSHRVNNNKRRTP